MNFFQRDSIHGRNGFKEFQLDGSFFFFFFFVLRAISVRVSRFHFFISVRVLLLSVCPFEFSWIQVRSGSVRIRESGSRVSQPDKQGLGTLTVYIYEWKCISAWSGSSYFGSRNFLLPIRASVPPGFSLFLFRGSQGNWSGGSAAGYFWPL